MIRVAMLSKWHVHAQEYAETVLHSPNGTITCVWDEDQARGKGWADQLGVDFESDLDNLLARDDVDAVVVCTPTTDHERVMTAAARAGKHIFTEKVLATTVEACRRISTEIKANDVKFCISFPRLAWSVTQYAKQLVDDGYLGDISYMRIRAAHNGALAAWLPDYWYDMDKTGGGAMMDLGCHPMYLASYFLGEPARVGSIFNNNIAPAGDDNAVSIIEFKNKAIAVLETGFITPYSDDAFELMGTEGALISINGELRVRSTKFDTEGWVIPDRLPKARPMAVNLWLDAIEHDTDTPYGTDMAEALTELLEHAYLSDSEQRIVPFAGGKA